MGKFCYTYINTHTFEHIKINCVLITIYVCAKAKECVLVRSYAGAITCCIICTTINPHGPYHHSFTTYNLSRGRIVDKL